MFVSRPAALAASLFLAVACSGSPPDEVPDPGVRCAENCDEATQFCNASGLCELLPEIKTRDAIARAREGDVNVLLDAAYVTYVVPDTSDPDLFGFFVQATQEGPAIFVRVDPFTVLPVPQPGDLVSLRITQVLKDDVRSEAVGISDYKVLSRGHDLEPITQEISHHMDLLAERKGYDSELVSLSASFQGDWLPFGRGHFLASMSTVGGFGNGLLLRAPENVAVQFGNSSLCEVSLRHIPFRDSGPTSHLWAFRNEDFTSRSCPSNRVRQVLALNPTEVRVTFERPIDPATVKGDGSQFTFTNGLQAYTAAVQPDGRYVKLITGPQASRAEYTLAIDASVRDVLGGTVLVPAPTGPCTDVCNPNALCLGSFYGWFPRAQLVINEVNCNIGQIERDLIELRAVTSGSTAGMSLTYDGLPTVGTIGVFPDAMVEAGDIIVVHLNANPSNGDAVCSEMTSVDQIAAASNYPLAWDFVYEDFTCAFSNAVLRVKNAEGATVDGVAVVRSNLPTTNRPNEYGTWLKKFQEELHWEPRDCNGLACSYYSVPTAIEVSADWAATATPGVSLVRKGDVDTNTKADWGVAASTFGKPNAPQ